MDGITIALIFLIGCLTGFLSGFLGVGGGFILVPLLIFIGVPTYVAIGSSLAYIVFTAISGAIQHYKQKSFDLKLALLILCSGVVTAQIGAVMTLYIEAGYLEMLLGLILLGAGIRMIIQKNRESINNDIKGHRHHEILTPIAIGLTICILCEFFSMINACFASFMPHVRRTVALTTVQKQGFP